MDDMRRVQAKVLVSIIKISTDLMLVCKDNVEIELFRQFVHDDIDRLYNLLRSENKGVENAKEN